MPPKIEIVAHPPERRCRATTLAAAGCCCCCCCCLHSVGSVVGALIGGAKGARHLVPKQEAAKAILEIQSADRYARKTYWLSLVVVALVTLLASIAEGRGEFAGVAFFVIVLGLPAGQLIASVLALIYMNVFPHPRKSDSLKRLGLITLYSFIGGLIGTAVMAAFIPMLK
jgi:hypothetical protein